MADRLLVTVIGERHAGKSTTWYELFGRELKSGPKELELTKDSSVQVYLFNSSNEESGHTLEERLGLTDCRIILLAVQYKEEAFERTWNFAFEQHLRVYAQWLNPGHDEREHFDNLGLIPRLLENGALISIRNGTESKGRLRKRAEEIRQHIHGWAAARRLLNSYGVRRS